MTVSAAQAQSWRSAAPLEVGRAYLGAAAIREDLYVVGGGGILGPRPDVDAYDVVADHWRPMGPLPAPIEQFAMAASEATLFVSGGLNDAGEPTDEVWKMTPGADERWTSLPALPAPRAGHAMVWLNDDLFVIGGIGQGAGRILKLATDATSWRSVAELAGRRSGLAAAVMDGQIYIVGGVSGGGAASSRVDILDPASGGLRRGPDLPEGRAGHVIGVLDGGLHVAGGRTTRPDQTIDSHYRLETAGGGWRALPPLLNGRFASASAVAGDRWYVLGGGSGGGFFTVFTATDAV
ncbi:MAG: kelch repeat-containing protein, partial [Pseudomonadota bacterium]